MTYKNIKKRTFEIIQASTENDIPSKVFDIFLIVLILLNVCLVIADTFSLPQKVQKVFSYVETISVIIFTLE